MDQNAKRLLQAKINETTQGVKTMYSKEHLDLLEENDRMHHCGIPRDAQDQIDAAFDRGLAQAFANPAHASVRLSDEPMTLPNDSNARKDMPIGTGVIDYFPRALAEISKLSKAGNDKHNPGQPLHWSKEKSTDHANCIIRHFIDRGKIDPDSNLLHDVGLAWRALANLEVTLEALAIKA